VTYRPEQTTAQQVPTTAQPTAQSIPATRQDTPDYLHSPIFDLPLISDWYRGIRPMQDQQPSPTKIG
jgi:hypothetical protein